MKIAKINRIGKRQVYDITVSDVNHYVLENGVVTHNTGLMYSANTGFIITKSQEKDGTDLIGYNFKLTVEKSRYVKEKSKLEFTVTFDGGIKTYSGLMDIALESGHVVKPNQGWYQKVDISTGELIGGKLRLKDTETEEFWSDFSSVTSSTISSWASTNLVTSWKSLAIARLKSMHWIVTIK